MLSGPVSRIGAKSMKERYMSLELNDGEKRLLKDIESEINQFGTGRGKLIPILQMVQQKLAYLPSEAI